VLTASPEGDVPQEVQMLQLDGVICRGQGTVIREMSKIVPTVTLDTYDPHSEAFGILPDYHKGVYEVVMRLLQAGHRRISLLTGMPLREDSMLFPTQVFDGCAQAYAESGLKPPKDLASKRPTNLKESYEAALELLKNRTRPEVIIASDGLMLGVYRAAYELGLRIPDDLSLIGIDGIANGAYFPPPLTTVDVNIAELGSMAVQVLTESINAGERHRGMLLRPVSLLQRESAKI